MVERDEWLHYGGQFDIVWGLLYEPPVITGYIGVVYPIHHIISMHGRALPRQLSQ